LVPTNKNPYSATNTLGAWLSSKLDGLAYIISPLLPESLLDNMDTQIFYRQRRTTAKYLEEELGRRSAYSRSQSKRVRIPRESCHQFHGKVAINSTAKLPLIPLQTCR
jgi:hypothetical protein